MKKLIIAAVIVIDLTLASFLQNNSPQAQVESK